MPLAVIGTPIGNPQDIGIRAKETLAAATLIIGEEAKVLRRHLKEWGIPLTVEMEEYNEHSTPEDLDRLAELCKDNEAALISDAGTPGFCDPAHALVTRCRKLGVPVRSIPGASSLASFLSLCGRRVDNFYFAGFLPAEREERSRELKKLKTMESPLVIMDTPYRLTRLLEELHEHFGRAKITLGVELTKPEEQFYIGTAKDILAKVEGQKLEFVLMVD